MKVTKKDLLIMGVKKGVRIQIEFEDESRFPEVGEYVWCQENNDNDEIKTITIETKDGDRKFEFMKDIRNIKVLK